MTDIKVGVFRVAAGAVIINRKNQVLLTQRALDRDHHPGEWEITTGRLDQGEGFEEAILREIKEELQINIKIIAPLTTFHFYRGEEKSEHVGVTFLARHVNGEVKVDGIEEVAFKWLSFKQAIKLVNDTNIRTNLKLAQDYLSKHAV